MRARRFRQPIQKLRSKLVKSGLSATSSHGRVAERMFTAMQQDTRTRYELDVLLKEMEVLQNEMDKRLERHAQSFNFCIVILAGVIGGVATFASRDLRIGAFRVYEERTRSTPLASGGDNSTTDFCDSIRSGRRITHRGTNRDQWVLQLPPCCRSNKDHLRGRFSF
jgi:hypothetical protein